jgi:uncharacterized membrane protein (UPF0127 family)
MANAVVSRTGIMIVVAMLIVAGAATGFLRSRIPASMSDISAIALVGPGGEHVALAVEMATTPTTRERGLMQRKELPEGHGMLFTFTDAVRPVRLSFWMKDTLMPLDILFFGDDGMLVSTARMEPCMEMNNCPLYRSDAPATYALEVPAGFIDRYGVGEGWKLVVGG